MPWDPATYNQFKAIRYRPFFDLLDMIPASGIKNAVDIGCGTGEQTAILAGKMEEASFLGIDASAEMLVGAGNYASERLQFSCSTIEAFADDKSAWDLLFSNAALQWADHHEKLFPTLLAKLNPGGHFAVQMPVQKENLLNQLLLSLVREKPYADQLEGYTRESPVLSIDDYAQIMFDGDLEDLQIIQKVYPIIADHPQQLYDFISGSSLIPYMERLPEQVHDGFKKEYLQRIEQAFRKFPAIYAFKRLLLYGRKKV